MLDANIVLDVLQQRETHQLASAEVLDRVLSGALQGCIPAHVVTTVFYILRKAAGRDRALEVVRWLISNVEVTACDSETLARAANAEMADFEDAVVAVCAQLSGCDFVVTRNLADFAASPVPALTPSKLLESLRPLS